MKKNQLKVVPRSAIFSPKMQLCSYGTKTKGVYHIDFYRGLLRGYIEKGFVLVFWYRATLVKGGKKSAAVVGAVQNSECLV